jgi:uncharacterized protein
MVEGLRLDDFVPHPWLSGPHRQTLVGAWLGMGGNHLPADTTLLRLPDGDCLGLLDSRPPGWTPHGPVAVIGHGLTGTHRSAHVVRLARTLYRCGLRVFRVDLRGNGAAQGHARGIYHAGHSDDLRAAVDEVQTRCRGSAIAVVGVSMSGNIALKMAAEVSRGHVLGLRTVVALCPPIDLAASAQRFKEPRNRLYERYFVRRLMNQAGERLRRYPEFGPVAFRRRMHLREFDDLYTAPQAGFGGVADYYTRASSAALIRSISIPTLILASRDDPLVDARAFHELRASLPAGHPVRVLLTRAGGHLGYIARGRRHACRHWLDDLISGWLEACRVRVDQG